MSDTHVTQMATPEADDINSLPTTISMNRTKSYTYSDGRESGPFTTEWFKPNRFRDKVEIDLDPTGDFDAVNKKYVDSVISSGDDDNVKLTGDQRILGKKTFGDDATFGQPVLFRNTVKIYEGVEISDNIQALKFITRDGTSDQYLMADGSVTTGGGSLWTDEGDTISRTGDVRVTGSLNAAQLVLPGPTSQNISSRIIFGNFNVGEKWDSNNRPNDRLLAFRSGNVDMLTLNNGNDNVFINKGKLAISRMSIQKATSDDGFADDSLGIVWDNTKRVNIDWQGNAKFEGEIKAQDFIDRYGKKLAMSRVLSGKDNGITEFWTMTQAEYDARSHTPTAMYFITE